MFKALKRMFVGGSAPTRASFWYREGVGYNWHCQDGNNEVVCGSTQGYTTRQACLDGIDNARDALNRAEPVEIRDPH